MGNKSLHHKSILSGYGAPNRRVCARHKILPLSLVWFPVSFKCYWQNKGMIHDLPTLVKVRTRQDLAGSFGSYHGEERSYLWNVRFTPPVREKVVWHCPAMYQTWQWSSRADLACLAWSKKACAVWGWVWVRCMWKRSRAGLCLLICDKENCLWYSDMWKSQKMALVDPVCGLVVWTFCESIKRHY